MADFNAKNEAQALHEIMRASEGAMVSDGGAIVAAKFADEAHSEFCRLDTAQKTATIAELANNKDISILTNGYGTPVGAATSIFNLYKRGYLSFACPDKK